jgi:hypothetical protein
MPPSSLSPPLRLLTLLITNVRLTTYYFFFKDTIIMISSENSSVEDAVSSPGIVSRSFYSAGYYVSYGIVFPTLWLTSVLPTNNVVGAGLGDGAKAAGQASERAHQKISSTTHAAGQKMGDAYAGVARRVQERVESVQDSIAERKYRRRLTSA